MYNLYSSENIDLVFLNIFCFCAQFSLCSFHILKISMRSLLSVNNSIRGVVASSTSLFNELFVIFILILFFSIDFFIFNSFLSSSQPSSSHFKSDYLVLGMIAN